MSGCLRQRNAALDWNGIDFETGHRLKQNRANAKHEVTKTVNRITEMIGIEDTGLGDMQEMDIRLNLVHEQFQVACRKYQEILVDEDDQDESGHTAMTWRKGFQTLGDRWQYGFVQKN